MPEIRFLGHSCFEISDGEHRVLIDPFLSGNPKAAVAADELEPTTILLTHGHGDHLGDTVDIAQRSGAAVVAIVELANELSEAGVEQVHDPNLGGTVKFDWGWVKLVPAWHTALSPNGTPHTPAGLLVNFKDTLIYHLGDTCLFSDLALASRPTPIDVAIVPIGGHYTMDRMDAVEACRMLGARTIIPCHYDTFGPIETDSAQFKTDVEAAMYGTVALLAPGETHTT